MSIRFLTLAEVFEIHEDQIRRYGGESGIRDADLLDSAVNMPQSTFDGNMLHEDIFEMAAAYLFHLVQNHSFVDGNKRVGTMAAYVFLFLNGYNLEMSQDDLVQMVLAVASGKLKKHDIASFLRTHVSSE